MSKKDWVVIITDLSEDEAELLADSLRENEKDSEKQPCIEADKIDDAADALYFMYHGHSPG